MTSSYGMVAQIELQTTTRVQHNLAAQIIILVGLRSW